MLFIEITDSGRDIWLYGFVNRLNLLNQVVSNIILLPH